MALPKWAGVLGFVAFVFVIVNTFRLFCSLHDIMQTKTFENSAKPKLEPEVTHAIAVPYRNRTKHLAHFLEHMGKYIEANFANYTFSIWIIEQADNELFNRGFLANVAITEIGRLQPNVECIIFHDVDLVPAVPGVPYNECERPTQLGSELESFNWSIPYSSYSGGIVSMSVHDWHKINGFSNDYVGWGGEDDDFFHRLRINGLTTSDGYIHRPPKGKGRFNAIDQSTNAHPHKQRGSQEYAHSLSILKSMSRNSSRWKDDGLSDLQYEKLEDCVNKTGRVHHLKVVPRDHEQERVLEFVHIPNNAGSAIEKAAASHGIAWGACHYRHAMSKAMGCPEPPDLEGKIRLTKYQGWSPWHVPLQYFAKNPFEGVPTFTIVRDPYDRACSAYYDKWSGYKGSDVHNRTNMNQWIQHTIRQSKNTKFLPQHLFIYNESKQVVDHVLHFETLHQEFASLMARYNLSVSLPQDRFNARPLDSDTLTVDDLTNETLAMIYAHFANDFRMLGYQVRAT